MKLDLGTRLRWWRRPADPGQRARPTVAQVREAFARDPARCFTGWAGEPYDWATLSATLSADWGLPNLTVRAAGVPIAWVQEITLDSPRRTATIGHFAIDQPYVGLGFGRLLATTLRAELRRRLGVVDLVFSERSTRYVEAGYAAFFLALGATEITPKPGWRADWLWRGEA